MSTSLGAPSNISAVLVGHDLMITGTKRDDIVQVQSDPGNQDVFVLDKGQTIAKFPLAQVSTIRVSGLTGNDQIAISEGMKTTATVLIDGGAGNDVLVAGIGNSILLGGSGNDLLVGSGCRDVLIGGDGADTVFGNGEDDILIGGRTRFDGSTNLLLGMLSEWNSADPYIVRVGKMRLGTDGVPGMDVTSVFYDGSPDILERGLGVDWFFVGPDGKIRDLAKGEQLN
jgi:Ca2+-binding RTX toxin-like protein